MINKLVVLSVGLTMLLTPNRSMAGVITLYDGASNVTPNQYNVPSQWLNFGSLNGGTQTVSGGLTNLDTSSSNAAYAGYSNYNIANPPVSSSLITPTTQPFQCEHMNYNLFLVIRVANCEKKGIF